MRHESRAQISDIFWKQITLEIFLVDLWIWILLPLKTSKVLYLQVAISLSLFLSFFLSLSLSLSYAKRNWHERDEIFNIYSLMSIRRNRWVENVISGSHRKEVPPNPLPNFLTSRRDLNELNIWRKKIGLNSSRYNDGETLSRIWNKFQQSCWKQGSSTKLHLHHFSCSLFFLENRGKMIKKFLG